MKVLFNGPVPFMLAHGGSQIQIEQTKAALEKIGLTVEPLRWWDWCDENQSGDVLHHFGRIPTPLLVWARRRGMKVVFSDLLGGQGARPRWMLKLQRLVTIGMQKALPPDAVADLS